MAIYHWKPLVDFYNIQREMNRMFDDYFHRSPEEESNITSKWTPNVDIVEEDQDIILIAELPGVTKDKIKLSVNNGVLTLSGEKPTPEVKDADCYHCSERFFGPFERKFSLPTTVNESKIKADFKDGVLRITLPKAEEAKPKEIQIAAE